MAGVKPVERELKLDIEPADAELLVDGAWFADAAPVQLVSVYFDTRDRALRRAGYLLRVRHIGGRRIQTVKTIVGHDGTGTAAGLFARGEWEREIAGDCPDLALEVADFDSPIAALLPKSSPARLRPSFRTLVERRSRHLSIGTSTVELIIDRGVVVAGKRSAPICEIEIELVDGEPSALFALARQLAQSVALRPAALAKSDRGLLLVKNAMWRPVRASTPTLKAEMPATQAFERTAAACLNQFLCNAALLLQDDNPELVHQARVGLRRLRSALSLFRPLLDVHKLRLIGAELRWLAQELGTVRNLDVLVDAARAVEVRTRLACLRRAAFAALLTTLRSPRVCTLLLDLTQWLALGAWRQHLQRVPRIDRFAAVQLDHRWRHLRHQGKHFAELDAAHRHQVRIEAKKLRYATELLASIYSDVRVLARLNDWLTTLEDLLDALGELNNEAVAAAMLASYGIEPTAVQFDPDRHASLRARADRAFSALPHIKRYWR